MIPIPPIASPSALLLWWLLFLILVLSCSGASTADSIDTNSISNDNNNVTSKQPENACFAYVTDQFNYSLGESPQAIDCLTQKYPRWGPPEFQSSACCNDGGKFYIMTFRGGGFDVPCLGTQRYKCPDYRCTAYSDALRATLCDPTQGNYVVTTFDNTTNTTTTTLNICQSSCDAVYENCGAPGRNFREDLTYTDGTSLCYEAWAGWDSHDPCDTNEFQFLCQQRMVLNITTTEDTNCLSIIYPSEAVLRSYSENQQPPDACVSNVTSLGIAIVVAIVVAILGAFGVLCIYIYIRHRLNLAEYGEAEERSR